MLQHPLSPLFDADSKILILGSFPSVKSREALFYYMHPQNRFWPLMARLLGAEDPKTVEEIKALLLSHGVALWDTVAACEIAGSADATIRTVTPNDLSRVLAAANIRQIFCNGKTAFALYRKYAEERTGAPAVCLPSTSPANAQCGFDDLAEKWRVILPYLT